MRTSECWKSVSVDQPEHASSSSRSQPSRPSPTVGWGEPSAEMPSLSFLASATCCAPPNRVYSSSSGARCSPITPTTPRAARCRVADSMDGSDEARG